MSPAPIQATTPARLRTMTRTRNRRRHSAARAAFRRITAATIAAGIITAAALAASALRLHVAESRERSIAAVARWTTTGTGPLLVRDVEALPAELNRATWNRWSKRLAAQATRDDADRAAADARLMEFIRGTASHVDEADLEIASPAIRARAFEKLD